MRTTGLFEITAHLISVIFTWLPFVPGPVPLNDVAILPVQRDVSCQRDRIDLPIQEIGFSRIRKTGSQTLTLTGL
jgi:hypothetical protein